mmetsp:Transcript_24165/g.51300  ORF Transcript_24165/g.51300 Transcript_24165/m.51300 type:complete len:82 (-) Transcript_24165:1658-1903(-)
MKRQSIAEFYSGANPNGSCVRIKQRLNLCVPDSSILNDKMKRETPKVIRVASSIGMLAKKITNHRFRHHRFAIDSAVEMNN